MKSLFRGIYLVLTLNCEQSAHLTSEGLDRNLSGCERIAITMHNCICKKSRKLACQIKMMEKAMRTQLIDINLQIELTQNAKARIQQSIMEELNQS